MALPFNIFGLGKPKSYLGVDIGTLSIKIVELSNEDGRPKLINYGILRNYALAGASSFQSKAFNKETVLMINRLLKESVIVSKEVNMSVPIFSSFLTIMELPQMSAAEIAGAVQFEARKHIPIPLDNVVIDWSLIGDNGNGGVEILLIAIPKDLINEYTLIGKEADLRPLAIELETTSAVRALIGNDPTPTVLIDMGSRDTAISIADKGFLRISHSIEVSGEDLTRALANSLNISWRRAEEIKKENGLKVLDNNVQIAAAITPLLGTIVNTAQNVINIYSLKTKKKIEKIIVYGGAAKMPGLIEYLKNHLQIYAISGNPFSRIIYPEKLKPVIDEIGYEFTVAVGLALKSLK